MNELTPEPPQGAVLERRTWFGRHVGIATGAGTVVSASKHHGGVVEQSIARFAGEDGIRVDRLPEPGEGPAIVARARSRIGEPYDPLFFNCEHLVSEAYGEERGSPQLRRATRVAAVIGLTVAGVVLARGRRIV